MPAARGPGIAPAGARTAGARTAGPGRRSGRTRRGLWPLLVSVAVVGVLFVGVFPTRTYLAQQASLGRAEERLAVLAEQNTLLDRRIDALNTDAEVERLAREQYNLVRPGEQAYAILPPAEVPSLLLDVWPFTGLADALTRG